MLKVYPCNKHQSESYNISEGQPWKLANKLSSYWFGLLCNELQVVFVTDTITKWLSKTPANKEIFIISCCRCPFNNIGLAFEETNGTMSVNVWSDPNEQYFRDNKMLFEGRLTFPSYIYLMKACLRDIWTLKWSYLRALFSPSVTASFLAFSSDKALDFIPSDTP